MGEPWLARAGSVMTSVPDSAGWAKSILSQSAAFLVANGHPGGVEAAGAVDAGAGVRGSGRQIQLPHRRPIAKIGKRRAKEQRLREASATSAQVAADQVFIHGFQIDGGMNRPRLNS